MTYVEAYLTDEKTPRLAYTFGSAYAYRNHSVRSWRFGTITVYQQIYHNRISHHHAHIVAVSVKNGTDKANHIDLRWARIAPESGEK